MCSAIFWRMTDIGSRSSSPVKAPDGPRVAPEIGGVPWLGGAGTGARRGAAAFGPADRAGAGGVVFGRNAIQVADPLGFQAALCEVVRNNAAPEEAARQYKLC